MKYTALIDFEFVKYGQEYIYLISYGMIIINSNNAIVEAIYRRCSTHAKKLSKRYENLLHLTKKELKIEGVEEHLIGEELTEFIDKYKLRGNLYGWGTYNDNKLIKSLVNKRLFIKDLQSEYKHELVKLGLEGAIYEPRSMGLNKLCNIINIPSIDLPHKHHPLEDMIALSTALDKLKDLTHISEILDEATMYRFGLISAYYFDNTYNRYDKNYIELLNERYNGDMITEIKATEGKELYKIIE